MAHCSITDLPITIDDETTLILFVDDTSILITIPNHNDFQININTAFNCVNEWLKVNLLSENFDKTHCIQFTTNNKPITDIKLAYDNKQTTAISNIKSLWLCINGKINWRGDIEYIIPKLSMAYYIMRSITPFMSKYSANSLLLFQL